ncbi:DUF4355 domain-containing protein [Vagococcus sp. CY52-2]|uniref:DUF4355 domain-containing protein n=2 Tax=Vagococcus sp. CY52-2 TaxID=2925838 RepID=UPI001F58F378|nr:DUF4355 domain-containing protein [Vagococcus sp. CY52-2]UNM90562.1 DUF4355 domain-containing protein [Vagococcus sp. CY52-2]
MEETEVQEVAVEEVEEKKEASPSKETTQQAKYTDEDVNAIVDKKFAKWQKDLEAKKQEAEKLAKMNAEQKALHEKEQLEKRIAEYEKKENIREMEKEARKMLSEQKIPITDDIVSYFVSEDAESTKKGVEALTAYVNNLQEQWEIARNTGKTPKKVAGNTQTVTVEQFNAMTYSEKAELARNNPEEFNKITGGH